MPYANIAIDQAGPNTVVAAVAGKAIRVTSLFFLCADAVGVHILSDATELVGTDAIPMSFAANGGMALPHGYGWFKTTPGEPLVFDLNAAVAIAGGLTYALDG